MCIRDRLPHFATSRTAARRWPSFRWLRYSSSGDGCAGGAPSTFSTAVSLGHYSRPGSRSSEQASLAFPDCCLRQRTGSDYGLTSQRSRTFVRRKRCRDFFLVRRLLQSTPSRPPSHPPAMVGSSSSNPRHRSNITTREVGCSSA